MKKYIIRYVDETSVEIYQLRSGKLLFIKSLSNGAAVSVKYDAIILSPGNYAKAFISETQLNFTPEPSQFLFSDKSLLTAGDVYCLPPTKIAGSNQWQQIWASKTKLAQIKLQFPSVEVLYPECAGLIGDPQDERNLNNAIFQTKTQRFEMQKKNKYSYIFLLFSLLCSCLALFPWIISVHQSSKPVQQLFDNNVEIISRFSQVSGKIRLPRLAELKFNNSLNKVFIKTQVPLEDETWEQLKTYCTGNGCMLEETEQGFSIRFKGEGM